jgi:protein-tyrosine-phosphatase
MAAELFRRLSVVGGDDAPEAVVVESAGLLPGGYASPPEVVTVMAELGIDVSRHRSTQVSAALVAASDVVVGMARRHAREVVLLDATAIDRTFTLKELVRRGDLVGGRQPDEELAVWLARLSHGRRRTDLVGRSDDDDVSDPLGGPLSAYRTTARELGTLVDRAAALLWAPRVIRTLPG